MKYVKFPVVSARRNPDKNIKTFILNELEPYRENPRVCISFTTINKIGINPSSKFTKETPAGVYAYPLRDIYDELEEIYNRDEVEYDDLFFAMDRPYIQVLLLTTSKVINNAYSFYDRDSEKLYSIINEMVRSDIDRAVYEDQVERWRKRSYNQAEALFRLTGYASEMWVAPSENKVAIYWTKLLLALGYQAAIDRKGMRFIYDGVESDRENRQVVFFTPKSYKHIKTVYNKLPKLED